jgi:hypothetical protein
MRALLKQQRNCQGTLTSCVSQPVSGAIKSPVTGCLAMRRVLRIPLPITT